MKKFVTGSYCFVVLCLLITLVIVPILNKSSTVLSNESKVPDNSLSYIVKEFNGNIAVFEKGNENPFKVTEVSIYNLPKRDQELLKEGIEVPNQDELNILLEDLCS